jgi:cytochrome c-type biogenesis protein CcmE
LTRRETPVKLSKEVCEFCNKVGVTMKSSGKRFIIGGAVIVGALVALVWTGMNAATLRAVPVHEVRNADKTENSFVGQRLRLVGFVGHDPIRREAVQTPDGTVEIAHFLVEDKGKTVQVAFRDALPDTFRAGGPVQVDGKYTAPGRIEAEHVLTKCPSKYEEVKADPKKKGTSEPYGAPVNAVPAKAKPAATGFPVKSASLKNSDNAAQAIETSSPSVQS